MADHSTHADEHARIDAELIRLTAHVADLGDRLEGVDTSTAVELAHLKQRLSALER